MAGFGFGLLTLLGFPGDPKMPVCYRCGVIIFSHQVKSFRSHQCHSSQPESTTQDDTPEEEEPVDVIMTTAEDAEDRYEVEEEEDDGGREDEMADQQPILHTRTKWAPLTTFLKNNRDKFSTTLRTQRPPTPIPAISVLPVQKGYTCPVPTCPHAYVAEERLRRHLSESHRNFHPNEDDDVFMLPSDSPMQSLRHVSAKPAFFKVIVSQAEPAPESLCERMMKALTITDGRDKARTINNAPLMAGPQHTHIFLKTFRYQSIFPADVSEYTAFTTSRVKHASPVYSPKRSPESQLITLSYLVYMLQGRDALIHTDDTIRRHIGNKDLWVVSIVLARER
jgi:Orsellinic acid/F9775 biosynthesis cluster protein D